MDVTSCWISYHRRIDNPFFAICNDKWICDFILWIEHEHFKELSFPLFCYVDIYLCLIIIVTVSTSFNVTMPQNISKKRKRRQCQYIVCHLVSEQLLSLYIALSDNNIFEPGNYTMLRIRYVSSNLIYEWIDIFITYLILSMARSFMINWCILDWVGTMDQAEPFYQIFTPIKLHTQKYKSNLWQPIFYIII
jgi:hypothetical protein